ncbi:hypothetical protein ACWDUL_21350 [Nocardia niigatensis]|nr:hypothetical protein [Nocardia niigatensis]
MTAISAKKKNMSCLRLRRHNSLSSLCLGTGRLVDCEFAKPIEVTAL